MQKLKIKYLIQYCNEALVCICVINLTYIAITIWRGVKGWKGNYKVSMHYYQKRYQKTFAACKNNNATNDEKRW